MHKFYVLGQLRLVSPDGTELRRAISGELRLALLAYLAMGMPGMRRRDTVLGMFWAESDADEARHRLRQVLYILRSELGTGVLTTNGREQVGVNPDRFWCDAVAFEQSLRAGLLEDAQVLYAGPFCDGLFISSAGGIERWLDRERERLHERAAESAWELARRREAAGDLRDAIRWGSRAIDMRPDEERLCRLIGMCEKTGDRLRALRMFARYERMLEEEYDLRPADETVRLIEALQGGGRPLKGPASRAARPQALRVR